MTGSVIDVKEKPEIPQSTEGTGGIGNLSLFLVLPGCCEGHLSEDDKISEGRELVVPPNDERGVGQCMKDPCLGKM